MLSGRTRRLALAGPDSFYAVSKICGEARPLLFACSFSILAVLIQDWGLRHSLFWQASGSRNQLFYLHRIQTFPDISKGRRFLPIWAYVHAVASNLDGPNFNVLG